MTAHKIGRNELCPCGSGKKYKFRCLKSQNHAQASPPATTLIHLSQINVLQVSSTDMLRNRVDREIKKLAEHFDSLVQKQFLDIDFIYSLACANVVIGKGGAEKDQDEVRSELAVLLLNQSKVLHAMAPAEMASSNPRVSFRYERVALPRFTP